jgi:hypothetical protein
MTKTPFARILAFSDTTKTHFARFSPFLRHDQNAFCPFLGTF